MTEKNRDFYKILGIDRSSSETQIKKAYRKAALKHHPDRNPGNEEQANESFKGVSAAYEVLSDPDKKKIYDKYGEEGLKEGGGGMHDPGSIFESFFGGGGFGGGRQQQRGPRKTEDIVFELPVELEDMYNGRVRKLKVNKKVICSQCEGEGSKQKGALKECGTCDGRGIRIVTQRLGPGFVTQSQQYCNDCGGKGKTIPAHLKCKKCNGKQVLPEAKVLEVHIEKGMKDGQKVTFHGEADQSPDVMSGDVVIVLRERNSKHPQFKRKGTDLIVVKKITLREALCGFKFPIKHMDDRDIVIQSQEGEVIKPGDLKSVVGEGMPFPRDPFSKGRLIVQFDVEFPNPEDISEDHKKSLCDILPAPEESLKEGDYPDAENYTAVDFQPSREDIRNSRGEAYDSDDEQGGRQGGQSCAYQ